MSAARIAGDAIARNPELACALRLLQQGGRDAFGRGRIARAIAAKLAAAGGVLSLDDPASYRAQWVEPIRTRDRCTAC